ncbi:hypothetical protein ACFW1A_25810 [Kitasatospora sp. NPDC058965]|uniref:hypothetical protein n=1 Tax=Kitasatospora sp. NPDC058965 TaxID=3346682 RepID=UPI0036942337
MSAAAATGPRDGTERRPRLVRGLAVVRRPDTLLVEGVTRRQVFTGTAATELLPRLFDLLDGEHPIAALAAGVGVSEPEVVRALRLLDRGGLVEWVRPDAPGPVPVAATDAYLSRTLGLTGRHTEVGAVTAALADGRVTVVGTGPVAAAVADCLRESGVPAVLRATGVPEEPQRLVVLCEQDADGFAALAAGLWARGIPVLRFAGDGDRLELGPFLHPRWTSCPSCWARADRGTVRGALPADAVELAAGLVCGEVLALLSVLTPPATVGRVVRTTTADLREEVLLLLPEPDCAHCLPGGPAADGLSAARYERAVGWTPWADRPRGGPARPSSRIQSQYEASPKLPLDRLPAFLRPLLTGPAPVEGVDCYLLGLPGSPYPVHLWDPPSRQLVATRVSGPAVGLGLPGDPLAALVLVATPVRHYGGRGPASHRVGLLEVGAVLAQLQRAADGCRLLVTAPRDPALGELLELGADQELPAVVVGVYREVAHAAGE